MADPRIPLKLRLKAWWDGNDLVVRQRLRDQSAEHDIRYEREKQHWETARIDLAQEIWGPGFTSPGGPEYICDLVKPFGLTSAMSMLDLGAGLGGPARAMAEEFGTWVTALEGDEHLAEAGGAMSNYAGMGKRAPVEHADLENFTVKERGYDRVFSKETMFKIENKERLFQTIIAGLKQNGPVLFTDYVVAKRGLKSDALDQWIEGEAEKPNAWSIEDYTELLGDLKLDTRVQEDITENFRPMITQSWKTFVDDLERSNISPERAEALIQEAELWARRAAALDSGDLKVCRIHAIAKDSGRLLSDW